MADALYTGNLLLEDDEIRFLRLRPGNWGDGIQCELVKCPLRNPPSYFALSYVWGSRNVTRPILVDGHVFPTTVNLESALRHLRHQLDDILLWVDALCINQTDNEERTNQVQLMGRIYQSSKGVIVYLGDGVGHDKSNSRPKTMESAPVITRFFDDDRDTPHIEKFLQPAPDVNPPRKKRRLMDRDMQYTVKTFSLIRALSWMKHLGDLPMFASKAEGQDRVLHLFESLRQLMHPPFTPWWERIWVVQEVILPPKVTIICGTVSAPWTMFARAASRYLHHIHRCCINFPENLPRDCRHVLKDFCQRVLDIENLRSVYADQASSAGSENGTPILAKTHALKPDARSLLSLLRRFGNRRASDPRDKVYALLSLVQQSSHRPPIRPDYSRSERNVYIQATLECIYSSQSLSVLHDLSRKFHQDLPSWVPDWESPGNCTHNPRIEAIGMYNSCLHEPVNSETVKAVEDRLVLPGIRKDIVVFTGEIMLPDSPVSFRETFGQWFFQSIRHIESGVAPAEARIDTLWRVFCADLVCHPQTSTVTGFHRADLEAELMFVTWALSSERSPFYCSCVYDLEFESYISETARTWARMLFFDRVSTASFTPTLSFESFKSHLFCFRLLFPEEEERRFLFLAACKIISREFSDVKSLKEIEYVRLIEKDFTKLWNLEDSEMPWLISSEVVCKIWSEVLKITWPELLGRLGTVANIGSMDRDFQVAVIDHSIVSATTGRRLFITNHRRVGLGPAELNSGDKVYLLQGGRSPFILRSGGTKKNDGPPQFKIIGDCYVHGLMDLGISLGKEGQKIALV